MRRSLLITALLAACSAPHDATEQVAGAPPPSPSLVITEPAAASWHSAGPVVVRGLAQDVTDVTLGGARVTVAPDEWFEATAELSRGITIIEVTAEGADGLPLVERLGVIAGTFADPAAPVADGLRARVNRAGLDTFGDFAETLVTADALSSSLAAINPVYDAAPIVGTQIQADVTGVWFDEPEVILTPTPGALALQVSLPALVVDMDAHGELAWIDFTDTAQITADRAVLSAALVLGAEDGQLTAELLEPVVTLSGFGYDIDFLWDELEGLFVESVRTTIEDLLVAQLVEMVPALLAEALAELALSHSTALLGTPLTVAASFASAGVDADGVELGVGVDVTVGGSGDKTYAGYLSASAAAPLALDTTAPLALALSDDLLNRALLDLWRGGMADVTLSTEDGTLDPALLDGLPLASAVLSTRLDLPPVIVESDGLLELQVAELQLTADTPGASIGDRMVATVDVTAQLTPTVRDSTVGLELGDLSVGLRVVESDWRVSEAGLKAVVEGLLSPADLQQALDGLALELPELYGLRVAHAAAERAESGHHTQVSIEVSAAE